MITILKQRFSKKLHAKLARKDESLTTFYFGYGANIDPEFFKTRLRHFEIIGMGELNDFEFRINVPCEYKRKGYGGLVTAPNKTTYGTVYKISDAALKLLDIMEWVPFKFYKKEFIPVKVKDRVLSAIVYIPCHPRENLIAPEGYMRLLIEGARKMAFPNRYIEYLSSLPTGSNFELDHAFNLSDPSKNRLFPSQIYVIHDRIREWLCSKI